jgi:hypothetical protein
MTIVESHDKLSQLELMRIVDLNEASRLSGMSKDSIRRFYRDKLIWLGPRKLGMRVKDALLLGEDDQRDQ